MTVYDQYDTEPDVAFSGSYGSRIFLGNSTIYTTGSFLRQVIGDSATAWFSTGSLVGKKYLMSTYPTILQVSNNNYLARQRFVRFGIATDYSEQFYDSVVGHPISYVTTNGVSESVVVTNKFAYNDTDAHSVLEIPAIPAASSIILFVGTSSCQVKMSTGNEEQFCDSVWNYTGPFQSRYKEVFRLRQPTYRTPTPNKSVVSQTLFQGTSFRRNTLNFTSSYDSISILAFTTQSGYTNEFPARITFFLDLPLSGASTTNLTAEFVARSGFTQPLMSTNVLYRGFFGFGDGPHHFPIGFYEQHLNVGNIGYQLNYVPKIRGWKYGLFDAQPRYSTAVWRYGRFGQMRDMLEQRPYTKFYNDRGQLESAVRVNFLTSSTAYTYALDYVSATNPSYDTRDTGFYDYNYRSGAPFQDIEPVD